MKIIIGLQARTNSKRLPGKVLKKINDKPLLSFVIDRLKKTKLSNEIFVLTSKQKSDDVIEYYCKKIILNFSEVPLIMYYQGSFYLGKHTMHSVL